MKIVDIRKLKKIKVFSIITTFIFIVSGPLCHALYIDNNHTKSHFGVYMMIFGGAIGIIFNIRSIINVKPFKTHKAAINGIVGFLFMLFSFIISMIFLAIIIISSPNGSFVRLEIGFYTSLGSLIMSGVINVILFTSRENKEISDLEAELIEKELRIRERELEIIELERNASIKSKVIEKEIKKSLEASDTLSETQVPSIINKSLIYSKDKGFKQREMLKSEGEIIICPNCGVELPNYEAKACPYCAFKLDAFKIIIIFLSSSSLDSKHFQIKEIKKYLERYPVISEVLYWEEDSKQNIVEFMEETLKKANVFVLFCSENSNQSKAVADEWQAAFQLRKKELMNIIPVYEEEDHIPYLLTPLS